MQKFTVFALVCIALTLASPTRVKRQEAHRGWALPAGSEIIVGGFNAGFSCLGRIYGYYADIANNCQIFHVCLPIENDAGQLVDTYQYSFFCGNQTIFDQANLVCNNVEEALPCVQAEEFYSINQNFGIIPPQGK